VVRFGDGTQRGGRGTPPATVTHTYWRKGTFGALLVVVQQPQYGGTRYVVPRSGFAIVVG
jgi:hypothetical protein